MSSDDQLVIKQFMHQAQKNGQEILLQTHVSADIKSVVKDLLQVCDNFQNLLGSSSGQSADARVIKRKYEQSKQELKAAEAKVEAAKSVILSIVEEIKSINGEATTIAKRHENEPGSPDTTSVSNIKRMTSKIIELIVGLK
jgi:molecular chaperone GrpE (heat shock protein)